MDINQHKGISEKYKVYSYPTLILFKNGKEVKFGCSRSMEFMKFWLEKKVQAPLISINSDKLRSLQADGRVNIVFYGDLSSSKAEIIAKLANTDMSSIFYQIILNCDQQIYYQMNNVIDLTASAVSVSSSRSETNTYITISSDSSSKTQTNSEKATSEVTIIQVIDLTKQK